MDNIQNEKNYKAALNRIWDLMKLKPQKGSKVGDELEMLTTLVEAYEMVYIPMQPSDPIAFLKYKMEKENLKQKDLIPFIGDKTKVSKVLNYHQELTITMIKKLSIGLNIPVNLFVGAN
jgi:HTH-type transcriptional regulator / antitoxin HigA